MAFLFPSAKRLARKHRLAQYRVVRSELERLSDADLADVGLKRYQLGHVARCKALN